MADISYDLLTTYTDGRTEKVGTIVAQSNPPPVNWVVITTDDVSSAQYYSGTMWEKIAQGRTLIGASDEYVLGSIGGSANAVVVEHSHNEIIWRGNNQSVKRQGTGAGTIGVELTENSAGNYNYALSTSTAGESGTGKNMQPYLVINYWKRVA